MFYDLFKRHFAFLYIFIFLSETFFGKKYSNKVVSDKRYIYILQEISTVNACHIRTYNPKELLKFDYELELLSYTRNLICTHIYTVLINAKHPTLEYHTSIYKNKYLHSVSIKRVLERHFDKY